MSNIVHWDQHHGDVERGAMFNVSEDVCWIFTADLNLKIFNLSTYFRNGRGGLRWHVEAGFYHIWDKLCNIMEKRENKNCFNSELPSKRVCSRAAVVSRLCFQHQLSLGHCAEFLHLFYFHIRQWSYYRMAKRQARSSGENLNYVTLAPQAR